MYLQPHGSSRLSLQWVHCGPPVLSKIEIHASHSGWFSADELPAQLHVGGPFLQLAKFGGRGHVNAFRDQLDSCGLGSCIKHLV